MLKFTKYLFLFVVVFFSLVSLSAQTGAGGIGNSNGENGQPENELWLSSSSLEYSNGDFVSAWADNSGNSNNAEQSNVGNQPVFDNTSYSFPILSFDGVDDFMPFNGDVIANKDYTIFFVAQRNHNSWLEPFAGGTNTGANNNLHLYCKTTTFHHHHWGNDYNESMVSNSKDYSSGTKLSELGIFAVSLAATEAIPRKMYQNNHYLGGKTSSATLNSWIGSALARHDNQFGEVDIAEVIIYSTALNDAQIEILYNYLNEKYNIVIENDKYTAAAGFNHDVAGIGNSGTSKHTYASSGGLYVKEDNASLNGGEYIFFSHKGETNNINTIQTGTNVTGVLPAGAAWGRDWYLKGVAGAEITLAFDFPEAFEGALNVGDPNKYALLYKANEGDNYQKVSVDKQELADADQMSFSISGTNLKDGFYTIGTTDKVNNSLQGVPGKTWYVLMSGEWDNWEVWTLDPSGNLPDNPLHEIPSNNPGDKVVIHSGKVVTIPSDFVGSIKNSLLKVDGEIDLTTTSGHDFTVIQGSGTISLAGDNFPAGDASHFYTEGLGEGTVRFYGAGYELKLAHEFFNIKVNLDNSTDILVQTADYSINGNLTISKGTWQINDETDDRIVNLNIEKDLFVSNNGKMTVGTGNTFATANYSIPSSMPDLGNYHGIFHQVTLGGNLTNNGIIRFTNQAAPIYNQFTTTGAATITFKGLSNTNASLNGVTDLYNLIVNKGVDQTYILSIVSSDVNNFSLYGPNNSGSRSGGIYTSANPEIQKALWIRNGTLKLTGSINIPSLTEGGKDYSIPQNGCLWIASDEVTVYSTASDASQVKAGSGASINTGSGGQALSIYGKFRITDGFMGTRNSGGFIIWSTSNGQTLIEGGNVNIAQYRSAAGDIGVSSYIQSGGKLTVRGNRTEPGEVNGGTTHPLFGIQDSSAVFRMSGGEILIQDISGYSDGDFYLPCAKGNYNVTGGTVTIEVSTADDFNFYSTVDLYNLTIKRYDSETKSTGDGKANFTLLSDMNILNDLVIEGEESAVNYPNISLIAVTGASNINDVYIGGSFIIESGAQYVTSSDGDVTKNYNSAAAQPTIVNTTYFNQTIATSPIDTLYWGNVGDVFDTDGDGDYNNDDNMAEFGHFVLDRKSGNELRLASPGPGSGYRSNSALTLDINGDASVLSGTFDQGRLTIRVWGAITNNDRFGTWYEGGTYPVNNGTPNTAQIRFREDSPVIINTTDSAVFGNIRFNVNPKTTIVELNSDVYIERMQFMKGAIYIKNHNFKVDNMWDLSSDMFEDFKNSSILKLEDDITKLKNIIYTDGKSSDGGVSIKIKQNSLSETKNNRQDNLSPITYPIGFTDGTNVYYRPAQINVSGFKDDSGYVQIRPVTGELQTTNLSGGEVLQQYWKVNHSEFDSLPSNMAYRFYYRNQSGVAGVDLVAGASDAENYVPGYVLGGAPFTRNYESEGNLDKDDIFNSPYDSGTSLLVFNGTSNNGEFIEDSGYNGFSLANANYTAGVSTRFTGEVKVFYTRILGDAYATAWENNSIWTYATLDIDGNGTVDQYECHDSRQPATSDQPGEGDIAVIGWVPYGDPAYTKTDPTKDKQGFPHGVSIRNNNVHFAEIRFSKMLDANDGNAAARKYSYNFQFRPTVCINGTSTLNEGIISGEGMFWMRSDGGSQSDPDFSNNDLGDFIKQDSSYLVYESTNNSFVFNNIPSELPNLIISSNGWGDYDRNFTISTDVLAKQNIEILGDANLILNNGAQGDITTLGDFVIFRSKANGNDSRGGGEVSFPNDASRTIEIGGDLKLINDNAKINIRSANSPANASKLIVHGNIIQDNTSGVGLQLYPGANKDYVELTLKGEGNHSYSIYSGSDASLYNIIVDKGKDQSSIFTFNNNFTLSGPTSGVNVAKALELKNGTLILDHASINIDINSGDNDFKIPATSSLKVNKGKVKVSGDDTGIWLDGKLTVSGTGIVDMINGSGNGNNYIEYSASGNSSIQIADNGQLLVGSQIRRQLNTEEGILKWVQSGGEVIVGQRYSKEDTRGVFEILNAGSSFTHSGGSFTLVKTQNNPSFPAFYFNPETANLSSATTINIGSASTPGDDNIEMYISKPLKNLVLNSNNNSIVTLVTNPLVVEEDLIINSYNKLNANGLQVNIGGDFENNGTYISSNNNTIFDGVSDQEIRGSQITTFYKLSKLSDNELTLKKSIQINDDLIISGGILNDNKNNITLLGDLYNTGTHIYGGAGDGITFAGSRTQVLDGNNGIYGKLTLDNIEGVKLSVPTDSITIVNSLKLVQGRFDIGGNSLIMLQDAIFIEQEPFSSLNMVQTNNSFTDTGIKKYAKKNAGNYIFPIGSGGKYTPVKINATQNSASSAYFVVKAANEIHPTVIEDTESPDYEIVDRDNVLQYYWELRAKGFTNLLGTIEMFYDNSDIMITNSNGSNYSEDDYMPARLLQDGEGNWNKYDWSDFDNANGKMIFRFNNSGGVSDDEINGDYTAGIQPNTATRNGAIPNKVPKYISVKSGNWSDPANWDTYPESGGNIPNGGPNGAIVIVDNNHNIIINDNYITSYSTQIRSTGSITQDTTYGNRLGLVSGTGSMISKNGSLPAGFYNDFFSANGGTIEYSGNNHINIMSQISSVNNLVISGTESKVLPNNSITVLGDLTINGADSNCTFSNDNNVTMNIKGDIIFNEGAFSSGIGSNSTVIMSGTDAQNIKGAKAFEGSFAFNKLEINNSKGISIDRDVEISNSLILTNGIVKTGANKITITNTGSSGFSAGNDNSYVDGKVYKASLAGGSFTFPLGSASQYKPIGFSNASTAGLWNAKYLGSNSYSEIRNTDDDGNLMSVSSNDSWGLESDVHATATVSLSWNTSSEIKVSNLNNLRVAKLDDSNQWYSTGVGVVTGTNNSGVVTSGAGVSFSYHEFTIGAISESILPIELISFTAIADNDGVVLDWATATELNNDYFDIERSSDGVNFESVKTVFGSGNSSIRIDYTTTDNNPLSGVSYYRLKQTDYDGIYTYSPIVSVLWNESATIIDETLKIYPNPYSDGKLNLLTKNIEPGVSINVSIINSRGKLIYSVTLLNPVKQEINLIPMIIGYLEPGIYIVTANTSNNSSSTKLIVE